MGLETLAYVVGVVCGLQSIYDVIRLIKRHKRAEQPMFWTQLMLSGGLGVVMVIAGLFFLTV
jgi:hypothetical protein